jgi:predicted lipoprotein with Yx(FWY)xxD motif
MTRKSSKTFIAGAAVIPVAALVAGCGGGGGGATASTPATTTPTTTAQVATIHAANSRLGKILVDSRGRTLYLFKKDVAKKSACFGMCATFWPPLRTSGKPAVGSGAHASLVSTTTRSDGKPQVTYNGHPLYTFAMDKKAGDTKGEGLTAFGGRWFAISPSGKQVSPKAAKSAGSSSPARPAAPAPKPAPKPAAPAPAPRPAAPKPAPKPTPPASNGGIPQNGGGDGDSDNNGGPSDGDGNV